MLAVALALALILAVGISATAAVAGSAKGGPRPAIFPGPHPEPGKGMLLVAAEKLQDPNFARSVILLVDYNDQGAMGLFLNRRMRLPLSALVPDLDGSVGTAPPLFLGGPVGLGRVILLIRSPEAPVDSQQVLDTVYVSASMATLEQLLGGGPPRAEARAFVGHAGWAPGQLEKEIERGDWHVVKAGSDLVFTPDASGLWDRLMSARRGRWVWKDPPQPSPRSVSTRAWPESSSHTLNSMEEQQTGQSS